MVGVRPGGWLLVGAAALALGIVPAGTPAPAASKPAVTSLRWLGLGADLAGREAVATLNGERDGHFRAVLVVPARTVLENVTVLRVFAKGGYAEMWDTNPGTSASHLAVFLGGKRLNPVDRELKRDLGPGRYTLDVYANDLGVFAPGQLYRLDAQFPGNVVAQSRRVELPGSTPTLTASFAGLSGDVVGTGTDQKPNGQTDAHFTARLAVHGGWQILTNAGIRRLTAAGAPDVPVFWMQGPLTAGLFVDGHRYLWPTEMPWHIGVYVPVDPAHGTVKLDLYANNTTPAGQESELFGSGQAYRVFVEFTDSQLLPHEVSTVVHIG